MAPKLFPWCLGEVGETLLDCAIPNGVVNVALVFLRCLLSSSESSSFSSSSP